MHQDPTDRPSARVRMAGALRRRVGTRQPDPSRALGILRRAGGIAVGALVAASAIAVLPHVRTTSSPSEAVLRPPVVTPTTADPTTTTTAETSTTMHPGYQLVTASGVELPFGATSSASPPPTLARPATAVARTPSGAGSWRVTADGGVITSGDALFHGSLGGTRLAAPVVGIAGTPSGNGYWLVARDGGVFAFGDASYLGGVAGRALAAPIVAMAPTATGAGYWLASSDGGVFTFGDAPYHGGMAGQRLSAPVVSIAPTAEGSGYWLAGRDGGVFTYGDASYFGSPAAAALNGPVVGIVRSSAGQGYWLASADGGVFTYGDAPFLGSTGGRAHAHVPVVAIAAGVGDPAVAAASVAAAAVDPVELRSRYGYDLSWPQCDEPYPTGTGAGYTVLGVTGGHPFSESRCLADEWAWLKQNGMGGGLYVNLATPVPGDPRAMSGPAGSCGSDQLGCQAWNFSANNINAAVRYAEASGADAPMWWLDVEGANRWSPYADLNTYAVRAAVDALEKHGITAGVYSTTRYWREITGGAQLRLPVWIAGAPSQLAAPAWCDNRAKAFTGGDIWLVQTQPVQFDVNYACDALAANAATTFSY